MILTHNYYIDFLKAFNSFLLKIFNSNTERGDGTLSVSKQNIQKITYSIGSKTILAHKLYDNENFEYPNIYVDLADIRVGDEGISNVSRNIFGLILSPFTAFPCKNYSKDQNIFVDTKRYLLNFNVQINVENQADLLNFYHTITNFYPVNYTFVDFDFDYLVDITELVKDWDFEKDDIYNIIVADYSDLSDISDKPNTHEKRYFTAINVQPEIEFNSITKQEDQENMKYSLNLSVLIAAQIPFIIYTNYDQYIKEIIINIDFNDTIEYPIFFDTDKIFRDQNIVYRIQIKNIEIQSDQILIHLIDKIPDNFYQSIDNYNFYVVLQKNILNILNLLLDKNYLIDDEYIKDSSTIVINIKDEKFELLKQKLDENSNNFDDLYKFSYFYILKDSTD